MAAAISLSSIKFEWSSSTQSIDKDCDSKDDVPYIKSGTKVIMYTPVHMKLKNTISFKDLFVKGARIVMSDNCRPYIFEGNNAADLMLIIQHKINDKWIDILKVSDIFSFTTITNRIVDQKRYTKAGQVYEIVSTKKLDNYGTALELKLQAM
jgi:hypothetical protein